jgi:hypothetical protein
VEVSLTFYQNYIVPLYDDENPVYFKKADIYIQKIIFNNHIVQCRAYSFKLEEICKQFLICLEESMLGSVWNGIPFNGYVCLNLFRDYYSDNFQVDSFKLFNIEEDLCMSFTEESAILENYNYFDDYVDSAQFMDFDIDESFEISVKTTDPIKLIEAKKESQKEIKFAVIKEPKVSQKISIAKDFVIKFTKRENVDKKVLRKFRKYLKLYKKKNKNFELSTFWDSFINDNLMPPMTYTNDTYNDNVTFKSFNTTYMLWLFSHKGGVDLYELFLQENKDEIISSFEPMFKDPEDKPALESYLLHFAYIYTYQELKPGHSSDDQMNQTTIAVEDITSFDNCEHCHNNVFNLDFKTDFQPTTTIK